MERIPGVQYASHVKAFMPSRSHNQLARRGGGGGGLPTTSDFPSATTTSVAPTGTGLCDNVAQKKGKLLYWGGPVIKNVEVTPLMWNNAVAPDIGVTSETQITEFYKGVTQSSHFDWMSEYCTPSQGPIGRGSGNDFITLSGHPTMTSLDNDKDIIPYLRSLVKDGTLQPNENSYYPIHFAPGIEISLQKQLSCSVFCAFHNTIDISDISSTKYMYYGVIPDQGGNCEGGCGNSRNPFDNLCSTSSHELIEAITDPAIGLVTGNGVSAPAAWYNEASGEIGDICNGQQGSITDSNGNKWTVQKEYSNNAGTCRV